MPSAAILNGMQTSGIGSCTCLGMSFRPPAMKEARSAPMFCNSAHKLHCCAVLKITIVPTIVVQVKLFTRSVNYLYVLTVEKPLEANEIIEIGLCNDNWYGYVERWIYENDVTWMEKTCATPFWTGMMLFCIDTRHSRRVKH